MGEPSAEDAAIYALRIGVQMGIQWMDRGSIVRVSADDAYEQVGQWVESPALDSRLRPLARRLVALIESDVWSRAARMMRGDASQYDADDGGDTHHALVCAALDFDRIARTITTESPDAD